MGPVPVPHRRQLTGELLRPVAAQRGRVALAGLFIKERVSVKALLCPLRGLLFFPLEIPERSRDMKCLHILLTLKYRNISRER